MVRKVIKRIKREYWRKFCDTVGRDMQLDRVWGAIKKMSGNRKEYSYPIMKDGHNVIIDGKDKAELMVRNFAKVHSNSNLNDEEKR